MSGSVAQSLGIITLVWGGQTFNVDKGAIFMPGGPVAKMVMSGNQITQAIDQVTPSSVKASFALKKGQTVVGLTGLNGSEMQVQCDSGQTFAIEAAYLTATPSVKSGAASNVSCQWGGPPATETIAS